MPCFLPISIIISLPFLSLSFFRGPKWIWRNYINKSLNLEKTTLASLVICDMLYFLWASLVAQMVKNLPAMWETWVQSLEKEMATYSSVIAWRIPWTEESGGLHSVGLQRVERDWVTKHSTYFFLEMDLILDTNYSMLHEWSWFFSVATFFAMWQWSCIPWKGRDIVPTFWLYFGHMTFFGQ